MIIKDGRKFELSNDKFVQDLKLQKFRDPVEDDRCTKIHDPALRASDREILVSGYNKLHESSAQLREWQRNIIFYHETYGRAYVEMAQPSEVNEL